MPDVRTNFVLQGSAKGFSEVDQTVSKTTRNASRAADNLAKGYSSVGKEVSQLRRRLKDLAVEQASLNKQMEAVGDKAAPAYKKLSDALKEVGRESTRVKRILGDLESAFPKRGAFTQGFLQGAIPGAALIQRGPGAFRQAMGVEAGRRVRGFGGGLVSTPFSGVQGIARMAQALPGGEAIAAPILQAMQFGEMAMQFQQQRIEGMPYLQGMQPRAARRQRRIQAELERAGLTTGEIEARYIQRRSRAEEAGRLELSEQELGESVISAMAGAQAEGRKWTNRDVNKIRARWREEKAFDVGGGAQREAEREQRRRVIRRLGGGGILQEGAALGFARPEVQQIISQISQMAGGRGEAMEGPGGFGRTALAAQRLFGVQAPTAGAFLRMQRMGAVAGVMPGERGAGGALLTRTIADAMEMGLDGADINKYLQQVAAGITQWEQTGIPVARDALAGFGIELSKSLGGVRGAAVAGGFVRAAQALSTRGPQTSGELLMFQTMGGFRGGGAREFQEAQIRMERLKAGDIGPQEMNAVIRAFMGGLTGPKAEILARENLRKVGINVGAEEMPLLAARATGAKLSDKQLQKLEALQKQRPSAKAPKSPEDMWQEATMLMKKHGSALLDQAGIINKQLTAGTNMLGALKDLEESSAIITKAFTELAADPMTNFTTAIKNATTAMTKEDTGMIARIKDFVGWGE